MEAIFDTYFSYDWKIVLEPDLVQAPTHSPAGRPDDWTGITKIIIQAPESGLYCLRAPNIGRWTTLINSRTYSAAFSGPQYKDKYGRILYIFAGPDQSETSHNIRYADVVLFSTEFRLELLDKFEIPPDDKWIISPESWFNSGANLPELPELFRNLKWNQISDQNQILNQISDSKSSPAVWRNPDFSKFFDIRDPYYWQNFVTEFDETPVDDEIIVSFMAKLSKVMALCQDEHKIVYIIKLSPEMPSVRYESLSKIRTPVLRYKKTITRIRANIAIPEIRSSAMSLDVLLKQYHYYAPTYQQTIYVNPMAAIPPGAFNLWIDISAELVKQEFVRYQFPVLTYINQLAHSGYKYLMTWLYYLVHQVSVPTGVCMHISELNQITPESNSNQMPGSNQITPEFIDFICDILGPGLVTRTDKLAVAINSGRRLTVLSNTSKTPGLKSMLDKLARHIETGTNSFIVIATAPIYDTSTNAGISKDRYLHLNLKPDMNLNSNSNSSFRYSMMPPDMKKIYINQFYSYLSAYPVEVLVPIMSIPPHVI